MLLTITGENIELTETDISFEQIAHNLIMVSVDNDINDQTGVFSYWRILGNGVNPPLEVGINTKTRTIKRIVLFVDADCIKKFKLVSENTSDGNVLVNTSIFAKRNDYIDVVGDYFVSQIDKKFMCKFNDKLKIKESIINGNIEFYVDDSAQLIGFAVNNLTETAIQAIKSLLGHSL